MGAFEVFFHRAAPERGVVMAFPVGRLPLDIRRDRLRHPPVMDAADRRRVSQVPDKLGDLGHPLPRHQQPEPTEKCRTPPEIAENVVIGRRFALIETERRSADLAEMAKAAFDQPGAEKEVLRIHIAHLQDV